MTKTLVEGLEQHLVREGEEALTWAPGPVPCVVHHEDAGGTCPRTAVMEVYGLAFCEVHGAEAKAGALSEYYNDAGDYLRVLDNPYAGVKNQAALATLREAVEGLQDAEAQAEEEEEAILLRAYPLLRERVASDTLDYDYRDPNRGYPSPVDWHTEARWLLHKLMRLAYEAGQTWLVEVLEEHREHLAAQLAFALADYKERVREVIEPQN